MQMMCSNANCGMEIEVPFGVPISFMCQKCGNPQVIFTEPVSIIDPANKQAIGRLKAGRPVNAEELRDVRTSTSRRAFVLQPVEVMEPPPPPPTKPPDPPDNPLKEEDPAPPKERKPKGRQGRTKRTRRTR